jgi:hypothetical protein
MQVFVEAKGLPVFNNVLYDTPEAARAAHRGDIRLGFCPRCGFISNLAFDGQKVAYTPAYENSLFYSSEFQRFAKGLAEHLAKRYDLKGKLVLEIGAGQVDFLVLLSQISGCRGVGFDPSYRPQGELPAGLEVFQEPYPPKDNPYQPDLILCRHVLEHFAQPLSFLHYQRGHAPEGCALYFETPDTRYTLRDLGVWDLIYEHPSYFTPPSMSYAFRRAGFRVRDVYAQYGGQFLGIEAAPGQPDETPPPPAEMEQLAAWVQAFAQAYGEKVDRWGQRLSEYQQQGQRVVIWGAGSKGVSFVNSVQRGQSIAAVDQNPRKQGRFLPLTGQPILSPEQLLGHGAEVVLVMNPLYVEEIASRLAQMGVKARLEVV